MDATEYKIKAMYDARDSLEREIASLRNRPARPWRGESFYDEVKAAKSALNDIDDQIIELEYSLRDPEQDAEIRAEINAAIAMSGNWNDDASHYMHTPMEERKFQEQIQHDINYGYYDEGGWNEGMYDGPQMGSCEGCNAELWDDDVLFVNGTALCQGCVEDFLAMLILMTLFSGAWIETNKWETEFNLAMSNN
jgi:hypothetical protein